MRHSGASVLGWIVVIVLLLLALFGFVLFMDLIAPPPTVVGPKFYSCFRARRTRGEQGRRRIVGPVALASAVLSVRMAWGEPSTSELG
jgi:hypothetical protein